MKRWITFTLFLFVLISVSPVQAAIFQVTTPAQLQTALTAARNNGESDTIRVAQGTYVGNFYYSPVAGENFDLTLEGGWSADFSARNIDPGNTILDGNRADRVLGVNASAVSASGSITVESLTIRNGFSGLFDGGGISLKAFPPGTVTLNQNIIEENEAGGTGGGFLINNDDSVTKTGGPIHITNNIIRNNVAASMKDATSGGGRINALNSLVISNNLIYGNVVGGNPSFFGAGGGLYVPVIGGDVRILNNTIIGNTAYTDAGGINVGSFGLIGYPAQVVQLSNNIIRGNFATTGSGSDIYTQIKTNPGNALTISHSDFHDLFTRAGSFLIPTLINNIDAPPLFVSTADPDPANWNLRLQPDSPCIDAGDNAAAEIPAKDLDGNPRVVDGDGNGTATVDMGAYESRVTVAPSGKDFGPVQVGQSAIQSFTVTNAGNPHFVIVTLALAGDDAAEFQLRSDTCSGVTLEASQSCTFEVDFGPDSVGLKAAWVTIPAGDPDSPRVVSLTGTGVVSPNVSVDPVSKDFGAVLEGNTSGAQVFTVSNTGTAPLAVGTITVDGANPGDFAKQNDTCSGQSIPIGEECTVEATFTPTTGGPRAAALTIPTNDPDAATVSVPLTGQGIAKVDPRAGTIGTAVALNGSGFGAGKPKVYLDAAGTQMAFKVLNYTDALIHAQWTKKSPPGVYNLMVQPKEKGIAPITQGSFEIKLPEIGAPLPSSGAVGNPIVLNGNFFGSPAKPIVYLSKAGGKPRKGKVTSATMTSIHFLVPKLDPGTYDVTVVNKIGTSALLAGGFEVLDVP